MIANVASFYTENGMTCVSFAKDNEQSDYIILSYTANADHQDQALGLDGLHIEVNEQSNGGYNCVNTICIDPDRVTLTVSNILGTDARQQLRIDIPPHVKGRAAVLDVLREICIGANVTVHG
jgi:hypothetical protein